MRIMFTRPYQKLLRSFFLSVFIPFFLGFTSLALAQLPSNEVFQLVPSDGTIVGRVVAVSDSLVGKLALASRNGASDGVGLTSEAYIFRWNGTNWLQEQKLVASDGVYGDGFGAALAIDGNVAVVVAKGSYTNNVLTGATYIFRNNGTSWVQEQRLPVGRYASNMDDGYLGFGNKALGLAGDVLVVGSAMENSKQGAAYVYRYHPERAAGDRWVQEQKLLPPDNINGFRYFGASASVSGERIVVGAFGNSTIGSFAGAAYVFNFNGSTWQPQQTLLASDGAANQNYGISVAIDGTQIAVGARNGIVAVGGGWLGPAVYMYRLNGSTWTQESRIPSDGYNFYGGEIALTGDTLLVKSCAAYKHYIYRKNGSVWNRTAEIGDDIRSTSPTDPLPACRGSLSASGGLIAFGGFDNYIQGGYVARSDIEAPHHVISYPSANSAGTVSPRTIIVGKGKNKTFSFAANSGYYLHGILVDNQRLAPVSSYTLNNIRENHGLLAVFGQTSDVSQPTPSAPSYNLDTGQSSGPLNRAVTVYTSVFDNVGVSKVEFYAGPTSNPYAISLGTSFGELGPYGNLLFSTSWDTTTVPDGDYVLTAKAFDTAPSPNVAVAQRTVTVNNGMFLLINSGNKTLIQGGSVAQTLNVTRRFGTPGNAYSFLVTGLPSGVTASLSPASCTTTCSSTMNLTASASATPGTFLINVRFYNVDSTFNLTVNKTSGDNSQYSLSTSSADWTGTVSKSPAQVAYTAGTQVTLTATPTGGVFSGWSGCVLSTQNPVTITMDSNKTCTAHFEYVVPPPAVITATAGTGGQITPYGAILSGTQLFQITPSSNTFRVADVLVDGVSVGPVNTYYFSNVAGSHTISATFAPYDFTLSNSGDRLVLQGQSVTNTITATLTQGIAPSITFSASGGSGVTASFNPTSCTPGCTSTLTLTASPSTSPGNYQITVSALGRTTIFNLTVATQTPTVVISSSSPPNGFVDPKEDQAASDGALLGTTDVALTFSAPVKGSAANGSVAFYDFSVSYYRDGSAVAPASADLAGTTPSFTLLSGGTGAGPYTLRFSPRIPLGAWTLIRATGVKDLSGNPLSPNGNRIVIGNLPMDITQDGKVLGDDISRWLAIRNGTFALPAPLTELMLLDQKRDGAINGADINRAIQLLDGIGTFGAWANFDMGVRP